MLGFLLMPKMVIFFNRKMFCKNFVVKLRKYRKRVQADIFYEG